MRIFSFLERMLVWTILMIRARFETEYRWRKTLRSWKQTYRITEQTRFLDWEQQPVLKVNLKGQILFEWWRLLGKQSTQRNGSWLILALDKSMQKCWKWDSRPQKNHEIWATCSKNWHCNPIKLHRTLSVPVLKQLYFSSWLLSMGAMSFGTVRYAAAIMSIFAEFVAQKPEFGNVYEMNEFMKVNLHLWTKN